MAKEKSSQLVSEKKMLEAKRLNASLIARGQTIAENIRTYGDYCDAVKYGLEIKRVIDTRLEFFEPLVKAARHSWQVAIDMRADATESLIKMKELLAHRTAEWMQKEEQARKEREAQIRDQYKSKNGMEIAVTLPSPEQVEGAYARATWTFKITDESAIPRDFLMPDLRKIGQYVRAMKENAKIDGVEISQGKKTVFRVE